MSSFPKVMTGAALLAALAASGAAQAYVDPPFSAPGVVSPGYPDFVSANSQAQVTSSTQTVNNVKQTVYTFSITASDQNVGIFNFPSGAYIVGNESIKVTANFDATGHLLSSLANTYEIDGSLKASSTPDFGNKPGGVSWATQPVEKLFSASLTNVAVDSTHEALGFTTNNFGGWANQKQFTGGGTSESLWLFQMASQNLLPEPESNQSGVFPYSTSNSAWNSFLAELKSHTGLKSASFGAIGTIATVPLPAAIWLLGSGLAALGGFRRRAVGVTGAVAA
jgi:hypothetical protein